MTTELVWTGTEKTEVFVDAQTNTEYWPKPADTDRPHTVPDERAEWLLDHDGWVAPTGTSADEIIRALPDFDDDPEPEPEAADEEQGSLSTAGGGTVSIGTEIGSGEGVTKTPSATPDPEPSPDPEPATVSDPESETAELTPDEQREQDLDQKIRATAAEVLNDGRDNFDPDRFVNETDWRDVRSAINQGEVDDYLDPIEDAEKGRDSPREASVLAAIESRRKELSDAPDDEGEDVDDEQPTAEESADGE